MNGCGTHGLPRSASYSTTTNAPARPEVRGECPDDRDLPIARDVMEAVGRNETVQLGEVERTGQVGVQRRVFDIGEARPDRRLVRAQRPPISIDRHDPPARPEQIGEGQRERALPRPDVGPRAAGLDGRPEQADVIAWSTAASRCSGGRPRRR